MRKRPISYKFDAAGLGAGSGLVASRPALQTRRTLLRTRQVVSVAGGQLRGDGIGGNAERARHRAKGVLDHGFGLAAANHNANRWIFAIEAVLLVQRVEVELDLALVLWLEVADFQLVVGLAHERFGYYGFDSCLRTVGMRKRLISLKTVIPAVAGMTDGAGLLPLREWRIEPEVDSRV